MVSPAEQVSFVLVAARDRGWPFDEAWRTALQSLPRPRESPAREEMREWMGALTWSRPFYAAAYRGETFDGLIPTLAASAPVIELEVQVDLIALLDAA